MGRIPQGEAKRGSQKWLQILVNNYPQVLDNSLRDKLNKPEYSSINWLSPRQDDEYAEYSDQTFLDRLGVTLSNKRLHEFWPSRGPVWDGLGHNSEGDFYLIEAKSHIKEMLSPGCQASVASRTLIDKSLIETKDFLKSTSDMSWNTHFYQYTNRLAHLYLLRHLNGLPVYLVNIFFVNDDDMRGPATEEEWMGSLKLKDFLLDLNHHRLSRYVLNLYVDINQLAG